MRLIKNFEVCEAQKGVMSSCMHTGPVLSRFDGFLQIGPRATPANQHKFALCIEGDCECFRHGTPCFSRGFERPKRFLNYSNGISKRFKLALLPPRPVTSLGHQEGRRVFREGPKFFELCPKFLSCVQHNFPGEAKIFLGGFTPPGYGPATTIKIHENLALQLPQYSDKTVAVSQNVFASSKIKSLKNPWWGPQYFVNVWCNV